MSEEQMQDTVCDAVTRRVATREFVRWLISTHRVHDPMLLRNANTLLEPQLDRLPPDALKRIFSTPISCK